MSYKLQITSYKLYILLAAFFMLIFQFSIFNCSAQAKFGHVDYGTIMKNMPGIDSVQTLISKYTTDMQAIGDQMAKEFKEKQAAFEKLSNTPNTSPAILKIKQDELVAMYKRIQEFAESMQNDIQDKQLELLEPFQTSLLDAIKMVAKANNYNYVFDISTLLFFTPGDDLTDKVKTALGIKL